MDWKHGSAIGGSVVVGFVLMLMIVRHGSPDASPAARSGEPTPVLPEVTFVAEPSTPSAPSPSPAPSAPKAREPAAPDATSAPAATTATPAVVAPLDPTEAQRLYDRAVALYTQGEYEAASSLLDRVLTARGADAVALRAVAGSGTAEGFDAAVHAYALLSRAAADIDRAEALALADRYREAHDAIAAAGESLTAAARLDVPAHLRPDPAIVTAHRRRFDRVEWFVGITYQLSERLSDERYESAWQLFNFATLDNDVNARLTHEQHSKLVELGRRIEDGMAKQSVT
ncbi:MAG: hypothetical protein GC159_14855 [Phycisphaera sp.]|nr:hypothetical protein [Phycisphaera sp.]